MSDALKFEYKISGENFASAGEATMRIKKELRSLGFSPALIRRVSIAMYEGEINMVIHAGGGVATILVYPNALRLHWRTRAPASPISALPCKKATPPRLMPFAPSALAQAWACPI